MMFLSRFDDTSVASVFTPHLSLIVEGHLADRHAAIFSQIRPWRVDDRNVVLLVA